MLHDATSAIKFRKPHFRGVFSLLVDERADDNKDRQSLAAVCCDSFHEERRALQVVGRRVARCEVIPESPIHFEVYYTITRRKPATCQMRIHPLAIQGVNLATRRVLHRGIIPVRCSIGLARWCVRLFREHAGENSPLLQQAVDKFTWVRWLIIRICLQSILFRVDRHFCANTHRRRHDPIVRDSPRLVVVHMPPRSVAPPDLHRPEGRLPVEGDVAESLSQLAVPGRGLHVAERDVLVVRPFLPLPAVEPLPPPLELLLQRELDEGLPSAPIVVVPRDDVLEYVQWVLLDGSLDPGGKVVAVKNGSISGVQNERREAFLNSRPWHSLAVRTTVQAPLRSGVEDAASALPGHVCLVYFKKEIEEIGVFEGYIPKRQISIFMRWEKWTRQAYLTRFDARLPMVPVVALVAGRPTCGRTTLSHETSRLSSSFPGTSHGISD